jgi:hypothetical protein
MPRTRFRPTRNNLVLIRAGRDSKHMSYCAELAEQNFDFALSWYDEGSPDDLGMAEGAVFVIDGRGDAPVDDAREGVLRCGAIIDSYDYVLAADDDVISDGPTVSRMFDVCRKLRLNLAQPALAVRPDCFNNHPITAAHHPFSVRYTNFVEPMAMISSRLAIRQLDVTSAGATSPYGADNTWAQMLPLGTVAIIDETPVIHSRRSNRHGVGLTADGTAASLRNRMRFSNLGRLFMLTYGGFTREGEFISMGSGPGADPERVLALLDQSAPDVEASLHQFPAELARLRLEKYLLGNRDFVASSPEHAHVHELLVTHLEQNRVSRFVPRGTQATFTLTLDNGQELPVRVGDGPLAEAVDAVLVDDEARLTTLRGLPTEHPLLRMLAQALIESPHRFLSAYARLEDGRSREAFTGLLQTRLGLDGGSAQTPADPLEDAHLDASFVGRPQARNVLEASGADTLARLEERFGPVEQAWLFAPHIEDYLQARERFEGRPEVMLFNMRLDAMPSCTPLAQSARAGARSAAERPDAGTSSGYAYGMRANDLVRGPVDLFTLDAAGTEAAALHGARAVIEQHRPVIAVAAHHLPDDPWRLMDEVLSIRPDYRVGMRRYGDSSGPTVLYFH